MKHETVHQTTTDYGRLKYGADTRAFTDWWYNPRNWAIDEIRAYSAGIHFLNTSLLFGTPYTPGR